MRIKFSVERKAESRKPQIKIFVENQLQQVEVSGVVRVRVACFAEGDEQNTRSQTPPPPQRNTHPRRRRQLYCVYWARHPCPPFSLSAPLT